VCGQLEGCTQLMVVAYLVSVTVVYATSQAQFAPEWHCWQSKQVLLLPAQSALLQVLMERYQGVVGRREGPTLNIIQSGNHSGRLFELKGLSLPKSNVDHGCEFTSLAC